MSPKDIAEKMTSCLPDDVTGDDLQTLARAYLDLENENYHIRCEKQSNLNTISQLQFDLEATEKVYRMNRQYVDDAKEEITRLKEENERLKSYVILGYETVHKESLEEITRLIEENLKLEEQVFKDTEYIGYIQDQLELSKSVLLQKTLDIDNLNASIKSLKERVDLLTPKIKAVYLNNLAASIHHTNVEAGWWTDLATGEPLERNVGELLCLVHSEISEALEAYRKDLNDDKLPHRKGFEVELADALIRIFDIAGKFMLDLDGAIEEKMAYNAKRADHKLENRQGANGKKF